MLNIWSSLECIYHQLSLFQKITHLFFAAHEGGSAIKCQYLKYFIHLSLQTARYDIVFGHLAMTNN